MLTQLRASLLLAGMTLVLCSVLYPLAVLAIGQGLLPTSASGSLIDGPDGKPLGSLLIAQEFKGDQWLQPRPSAAGYNAAASGGSNWGANNPKLRDRASRQLGPVVKYRPGVRPETVQADIEAWFAARPDRFDHWLKTYSTSAANWLADSGNTKAIDAWKAAHPGDFFETFTARFPGTFPAVESDALRPTATGPAVHSALFEMWLQDNPEKARDIEPVPADAVTSSGSGLDPHITLRNARSQLDRITAAWVAKTVGDPGQIRAKLESVINDAAFAPLAGLAQGEPIVNVLEINITLASSFSPQ